MTLVFKGIKDEKLLKIAPSNDSYYGMNPEHLKDCDRMHYLTREIEDDNPCDTQPAESEGHHHKRARLDNSPGDLAGPSNA